MNNWQKVINLLDYNAKWKKLIATQFLSFKFKKSYVHLC